MHLQWFEAGALGTNAIVGGGAPFATGNAWAQKHSGTTDLTINYFGDGASQIGSVLESMNLAAAWKLPVVFFIENNLYGVSTHVSEVTADTRLSVRGQGFGIPSWRVDGMDPLAVHLAMTEVAEHLRAGRGPAVVEAEVYRFFHQNGPYPGSAFGYRTKEEEASWRERDPLLRIAAEMRHLGLVNDEEVASVRAQAQDAMRAAVGELLEPDPESEGKRRIRPSLWPDPEFVDVGVRGDASELADARTLDPVTDAPPMTPSKFVDAVAAVMGRRMEQDERIVVLGEDVHRLSGGTNGATKGLAARFPDRVLGTPISENAFAGLGGGLALDGRFRPVVEFMYPDFMWVAADQVFNQIGKARHMFGGVNPVPLVLRTKVAMGSGYGSQHLMDPAGIFATSPGWRICAPSTAADYVGLMNTALALDDPVLVIEHVDLYGRAGRDPRRRPRLPAALRQGGPPARGEGRDDHQLPVDGAPLPRSGRSDRAGCRRDRPALARPRVAGLGDASSASVQKTNAVLIVEQGARGTSYGGWLADEIQRRLFDWLDQPVQRVTGSEAGPSISKVLERAAIARTEEVVAGIELLRAGMGGVLMATVVRMPEVLAGVSEAAIATWLVAVGDRVGVGTPLAEIETEKAVVEYASEVSGTVLELLAEEGAGIAVGAPIVVIGASGEVATPSLTGGAR